MVAQVLIQEYRYFTLGKIILIPGGQDPYYYDWLTAHVVLQSLNHPGIVFRHPIASVEDIFGLLPVRFKVCKARNGLPGLRYEAGREIDLTFDDLMLLHLKL